jgi:hypothetical protein
MEVRNHKDNPQQAAYGALGENFTLLCKTSTDDVEKKKKTFLGRGDRPYLYLRW